MFYRVVVIFPDTNSLAEFVEWLESSGEIFGNEYTFVGNLTAEQIKGARNFGGYVRAARELE